MVLNMEYINTEIDALTGEITVRNYTAQEIKEVEDAKIEMANRLAKLKAIEDAKATAQIKLAALGLTIDELKAIGL